MTLIADAGGTNTTWCINKNKYETSGINPFQQDEKSIREIVENLKENLLKKEELDNIDKIRFYGAGCTPEKSVVVKKAISEAFGDRIADIDVQSDLLGAAIGLCGNEKGVACILGTGSNSCLYDGEKIVQQTPALGYVLGDEGSGAVLGRMFLNAMLKGRLDKCISDAFFEEYKMTQADIIERVYRQPLANRFLASLTVFVGSKRDNAGVLALIKENLANFLDNNVKPYDCKLLNFTGSIAYHFAEILRIVAAEKGYEIGKITQSPVEGLIEYYGK